MKLYVASSWRNAHQPGIVADLRELGHEVYDFRHPPGGEHLGFSWSDVDRDWVSWTPEAYRDGLEHPIAVAGFESDFGAMQWANGCVLVLPCGRSAHLEAGWFVGADKPLWILLDPAEFGVDAGHHVTELMYRMATRVVTGLDELVDAIAAHSCVYCKGRRWVNDENWQPDDPRDPRRSPHDGLLPCDGCNFAGWDTAEWAA
jgi:hypothetical protein